MSHTPGPWTVHPWSETVGSITRQGFIIRSKDEIIVQSPSTFVVNNKVVDGNTSTEDNAYMLATAPEMHELLNEIASTYGSRSEIGKRMKAVLRKAKPPVKHARESK